MHSRSCLMAAAGVAIALGAQACAPVTAVTGFQVVDAKPQDAKVGVDTRDTIQARLGSPSVVSTFDPNVWYYISQTADKMAYLKPKVKTRSIVAISFDKSTEKVVDVRLLGLKDGYDLAYNRRETPTRGRELSVFEQLIGTIGRGGVLPPDVDPGQRPGQPR